jgi:hypothetical protein
MGPKKANAKSKSTPNKAVTASSALVVYDDKKPRAKRLHDVEDKVERLITGPRLNAFDRAVVEGAVNKDGVKLRVYVEAMLKEKGPSEKWNAKFWSDVHVMFNLGTGIADQLPDPSDDEEMVSAELQDALRTAHHKNPAMRKSDHLVRFLEHCAPLNKSEMFGLLGLSMEGPTLLRSHSLRMQIAILKYFSRTRQHAGIMEPYWKIIKHQLDYPL